MDLGGRGIVFARALVHAGNGEGTQAGGCSEERQFATKVELGWQMIQRVRAHGLPFEGVACDDLYGRNQWLRQAMDRAGILYMAEVPENTQVYLTKPELGVPPPTPGKWDVFRPVPKC